MKKVLANIITTSTKIKFDLPVNRCKDMSCVDNGLPTLIIGYELAKKYIDDFNILKKSYPDKKLYWTFKRTERAIDYESDLSEFYTTVILDFCDKIEYKLLDFFKIKLSTAKKLINFIKSDEKKVIFNENNNFLYIYSKHYNTVFGFSLATSRFFGIKTNKIVKMLKSTNSCEFIDDFSHIPYDIKQIIGEKIDKYIALCEYFAE